MGLRLVALGLILGALWDVFTTFHGVAAFFDLPMDPKINPAQFAFGLVVTMVVFGFVMATHLIWTTKAEETPALLLKAAWAVCIAIDLFTSWQGTKSYVFYGDEGDAARDIGLAVVTALIVSSSIFLSRLLLEEKKKEESKGKKETSFL
jgi:tryptophan-rich sensory protein